MFQHLQVVLLRHVQKHIAILPGRLPAILVSAIRLISTHSRVLLMLGIGHFFFFLFAAVLQQDLKPLPP